MPFHPLQPLSAAEVAQAVALLRTLATFTATTRVISIMLREPDKTLVYNWTGNEAPAREAEAVLFDNRTNTAYAIVLDLTAGAVVSQTAAPAGSQPTLSVDEQIECEQAVIASPEFRAAP